MIGLLYLFSIDVVVFFARLFFGFGNIVFRLLFGFGFCFCLRVGFGFYFYLSNLFVNVIRLYSPLRAL